jgi:hypothetical protein
LTTGGDADTERGMQFDALVRLIEATTPAQLRDIARALLQWLGHDARVTDGPYDGGADVRLYGQDGAALPVAVAVSVERAWEKKLRADVYKVRDRLGLHRVYFFTSRRVPEASFLDVSSELLQQGLDVTRYDQQSIASVAISKGRVADLLDLLGVPSPSRDRSSRVSFITEGAFAFAFFAEPTRELRREVRERAVELAVHLKGSPRDIADVAEDLRDLLGTDVDPGELRAMVDRMRQAGRIGGRNGSLTLPEHTTDTLDGLLRLRDLERARLEQDLDRQLAAWGYHDAAAVRRSMDADLGALLLPSKEILRDQAQTRAAMRRVTHALLAHAPPGVGADAIEARLTDLVGLVARSPLAIHLRVGAILRAVQVLPSSGLAAALGSAEPLRLVLDASVAIPLLCVLFHGPRDERRFFRAARLLFDAAERYGVPLALPAVWLEEMAAHLLKALDFEAVVAIDRRDLVGSRNAFVSYYAAASATDPFPTLAAFLGSFGVQPDIARRLDFVRARRTLEGELRRLLTRYGVDVIPTDAPSHLIATVQAEWAWNFRDDVPRAPITAQHDQQVLAWLRDTDRPAGTVLVSWDRRLPNLAPAGRVFDPIALLDLMGTFTDHDLPSNALGFVAQTLADEATDRASKVWDELVRLEHGGLSDSALAERALAFKEQFVAGRHKDPDLHELREAWERARAVD